MSECSLGFLKGVNEMPTKVLTLFAFLGCGLGLAAAQAPAAQSADDTKAVSVSPVAAPVQQDFEQSVKDVRFEFDRAQLRDEDKATLAANAQWLKAHPDVYITLEGDADERGDIVYNLVLSGERANVTKDALVGLGVPADHILFATGWGKLYPICAQQDETCWSQNRRTHFATWPALPEATQIAARNANNNPAGQ
jgi:peptidoglycan-associated lipoprotein